MVDLSELEGLALLLKLAEGGGSGKVQYSEEDTFLPDWGYSVDNPVLVRSIPAGYLYLERLRTADGQKITYDRIGSMHSEIGAITDGYDLKLNGRDFGTIYICPYGTADSQKAPAGLKLV